MKTSTLQILTGIMQIATVVILFITIKKKK